MPCTFRRVLSGALVVPSEGEGSCTAFAHYY